MKYLFLLIIPLLISAKTYEPLEPKDIKRNCFIQCREEWKECSTEQCVDICWKNKTRDICKGEEDV